MYRPKEKQSSASPLVPLPVVLSVLLLITALFTVFRVDTGKVLKITDQDTGKEYFSTVVAASDVLTYGWIHSLERIPWTEEYIILDNNNLLLKRIIFTAFGAGIPHNRGRVIRVENGLIVMDKIDEEFERIEWIHSQTANEYIMLNGKTLLKGEGLPHHLPLRLEIEKGLRIWPG